MVSVIQLYALKLKVVFVPFKRINVYVLAKELRATDKILIISPNTTFLRGGQIIAFLGSEAHHKIIQPP